MLEDIIQGSFILGLGMSTTALFLSLIIVMVIITAKVVKFFGLDKEETVKSSSHTDSGSDKSKIVAVIAAVLKSKK